MRATLVSSVVLLAALGAACGGSTSSRMNSQIQRGPMPEGGTWAGIWFTSWGEMSISTQGSSVVGEFCQEERNRFGRLEGTTQGDVMTLRWVTSDVTMSGTTRQTEGSAIVQFSFVQSGENRTMHFEGTWGYERSNADGGVLRGDRSPQRSEQFLRGDYNPTCSLREAAESGPALSTEDVGDNPDMEQEEETTEETEDEGEDEPIDDLPM